MSVPTQDEVSVYRLLDSAGRLLYIGITNDLERRWGEHMQGKFWWHLVARKEVMWHETRREAEAAERLGIQTEGPIYNRTLNKNKVPRRAVDPPLPNPFLGPLVARLREEIQTGLHPEGHVFHDDLETALGLGASPITLWCALRDLVHEGLVSEGPYVKRVRRKRPVKTWIVGAPPADANGALPVGRVAGEALLAVEESAAFDVFDDMLGLG